MNDPLGPSPDWTAIFDRAHRRVARRLLLLGGIGIAGALLLLSSGLTANGSITWNIASTKNEPKKQASKHKPHGKHEPPLHQGPAPSVHHDHKASNDGNEESSIGGHPKKPKCTGGGEGAGDSADKQYEDCPPKAVEEEEEEEKGISSGEEGDQSSLSGATSTGR